MKNLIKAMKTTNQTKTQSIYDHGKSVHSYFKDLLNHLQTNEPLIHSWKIPEWLLIHRTQILDNLLDPKTIKYYQIFHDCGKPYCQTIDENGNYHFPNHAEVSYQTYYNLTKDQLTSDLIRRDMEIHTIKDKDIQHFIRDKRMAITLLITGLCEIHSNAEMFGGINSESFKIKYSQINRRGKAICRELFEK